MRYPLSNQAKTQTENVNPQQLWFFVMSSRKASAVVVAAHIAKDTAQREARKLGSVSRMGVIINGQADTL